MNSKLKTVNITIKLLIGLPIYFLFLATGILTLANDWYWVEGWAFLLMFFGMVFSMSFIFSRRNPELLKKRTGSPFKKGQPTADKIILIPLFISVIAWFLVMPVEHQFPVYSFPFAVTVIGGVFFALSMVFYYKVFAVNAFLSQSVELQKNQTVVSTGPYKYVRHPMYASFILMSFSGALLLSSVYGLLFAGLATITFYIRTFIEEKLLEKGLKGYKEYKGKVKYRLIPYLF